MAGSNGMDSRDNAGQGQGNNLPHPTPSPDIEQAGDQSTPLDSKDFQPSSEATRYAMMHSSAELVQQIVRLLPSSDKFPDEDRQVPHLLGGPAADLGNIEYEWSRLSSDEMSPTKLRELIQERDELSGMSFHERIQSAADAVTEIEGYVDRLSGTLDREGDLNGITTLTEAVRLRVQNGAEAALNAYENLHVADHADVALTSGSSQFPYSVDTAQETALVNEFSTTIAPEGAQFDYRIEQQPGISDPDNTREIVLVVSPREIDVDADLTIRLSRQEADSTDLSLGNELVDKILAEGSSIKLQHDVAQHLEESRDGECTLSPADCAHIELAMQASKTQDKAWKQETSEATFSDADIAAVATLRETVSAHLDDQQMIQEHAGQIITIFEKGRAIEEGETPSDISTTPPTDSMLTEQATSLIDRLTRTTPSQAELDTDSEAFQALKKYLRTSIDDDNPANSPKIHGARNIAVSDGNLSYLDLGEGQYENFTIRNSQIDHLRLSGSAASGLVLHGNQGKHVRLDNVKIDESEIELSGNQYVNAEPGGTYQDPVSLGSRLRSLLPGFIRNRLPGALGDGVSSIRDNTLHYINMNESKLHNVDFKPPS